MMVVHDLGPLKILVYIQDVEYNKIKVENATQYKFP